MLNVQRVRKSCSQRLQLKHYTIIFIDIDICKKKMLLTHILMLQKKSNKYPCITFNLSIIFVKCNEKKKQISIWKKYFYIFRLNTLKGI